MLSYKQLILRIVFAAEIAGAFWMYRYGTYGTHTLAPLQGTVNILDREVAQLQQDIKNIEYTICMWQEDSFFIQAYARQNLNMAAADETVYIVD